MLESQISAQDAEARSCLFEFGMPFQPETFVRSEGSYTYTSTNQRILDWSSGQISTILGHGHPEIAETVSQHVANLDHLYSGMVSPPVVNLAKGLTSILPPGLDRAFFLSTGSESNEAAIKICKLITGKFEIIGLNDSWHGMTAGSCGAQYHAGRKGYGPAVSTYSYTRPWRTPLSTNRQKPPGNLMLPCPNAFRSIFRHDDGSYNWKAELDYGFDMVDKASCGSLAALIIEPILSSGGMHVLPDGYLRAIRKHCDDRSMLLIIDEAQTGLGRTGTMFAFEHDGVTPDILTLSKTLGNGYPLSVVVTSHAIAKSCQERGLFFGTTHVNDPLAAAVGLRVLGIAIRESLPERAKMLGDRLVSALEAIKEKNSSIGDIRGRGLLIGVEIIDGQTRAPNPALGLALCREMKQNGLWVNFSPTSSTFRIVPPSTTTMLELDAGIKIIKSVFQVQD